MSKSSKISKMGLHGKRICIFLVPGNILPCSAQKTRSAQRPLVRQVPLLICVCWKSRLYTGGQRFSNLDTRAWNSCERDWRGDATRPHHTAWRNPCNNLYHTVSFLFFCKYWNITNSGRVIRNALEEPTYHFCERGGLWGKRCDVPMYNSSISRISLCRMKCDRALPESGT